MSSKKHLQKELQTYCKNNGFAVQGPLFLTEKGILSCKVTFIIVAEGCRIKIVEYPKSSKLKVEYNNGGGISTINYDKYSQLLFQDVEEYLLENFRLVRFSPPPQSGKINTSFILPEKDKKQAKSRGRCREGKKEFTVNNDFVNDIIKSLQSRGFWSTTIPYTTNLPADEK
jgi:hypothetical protein